MNNSGSTSVEKRLCKKCGKKLPSKTNFCMYCGFNNDHELNEDIVPDSKDNKNNKNNKEKNITNSNNKSISSSIDEGIYKVFENPTKLTNAIFSFIILIIVIIIFIFMFYYKGLFVDIDRTNYKNNENTFYVSDDVVLTFENNKIKVTSEDDSGYKKAIKKLNKDKIIDFKAFKTYYQQNSDSITIAILTKDEKLKYYTLSDTVYDIYDVNTVKAKGYTDALKAYNELVKKYYLNEDNIKYQSSIDVKSYKEYTGFYIDKNDNIKTCTSYSRGQIDADNTNNNGYICDKTKTVIKKSDLGLDKINILYNDGYTLAISDNKKIAVINNNKIVFKGNYIYVNNKKIEVNNIKYFFHTKNKYKIIDKDGIVYSTYSLSSKSVNTSVSLSIVVALIKNMFKSIFQESGIQLLILVLSPLIVLGFLYIKRDYSFKEKLKFSLLIYVGCYLLALIINIITGDTSLNNAFFKTFIYAMLMMTPLYLIISIVSIAISESILKLLKMLNLENVLQYIVLNIFVIFLTIYIYLNDSSSLNMMMFALIFVWYFLCNDPNYNKFTKSENNNYLKICIMLIIISTFIILAILNLLCIANHFIAIIVSTIFFAIILVSKNNFNKESFTTISLISIFTIYILPTIINIISKISELMAYDSISSDSKSSFSDYFNVFLYYILCVLIIGVIIFVMCYTIGFIIKKLQEILNNIGNKYKINGFFFEFAASLFVIALVLSIPFKYCEKVKEKVSNLAYKLIIQTEKEEEE